MARKDPNSKITSYRRHSWLNIGTLLFGAIGLYIIISLFLYVTADHVTSYEVIAGSISGNYRYTALALKTETVQTAPYTGYVTYYTRNGQKTGSGSVVCAISDYDDYAGLSDTVSLSDSDYSALKTIIKSYAINYSSGSFQQIYSLASELDNYILGVRSDAAVEDANIYLTNIVTAPASGFVVYQTDGMEELTEADLKTELFNLNNYSPVNLRTESQVTFGSALYKLVEGEEWYLYFPISADLAASLSGRETVRFRFLKDDTTFSGGFSIVQNNGAYFGKLSLRNSLVRYVGDRYLDIELLMDSKSGLKIPISSISEKVFYQIPSDYVTVNEDDPTEITLIRESFNADGSAVQTTITATVYDETDAGYLISTDLIDEGDYVRQSGTDKRYKITDEDLVTIQGVYNINKGYAVFRQVTIIDQNEEFCVVSPNSIYGLAAHDYIVLDASKVNDDDIVY